MDLQTTVAVFQIRFVETVQFVHLVICAVLCRVYLRNPLDPPDISGVGKDQHGHANKDKRKCSVTHQQSTCIAFNRCIF